MQSSDLPSPPQIQLNPFPDVQTGLLTLVSAVHVRKSSQTKAVPAGRVHIPVHDDAAE